MRGQIVHDNHIALAQFRHQNLFDIGDESLAVYRSVQHHGGDHAAEAQSSGEGCCLPMAVRNGGNTPLTAWRPAAQACHLRRSTGFVDEDETFGIKIELPLEPDLPGRPYIVTLLFARMRRLFLYVMPRLLKKCQTVAGQAET